MQISRCKRVIGDTLRSRGHLQRKTEAGIAVKALSRMNEPGRPISVGLPSCLARLSGNWAWDEATIIISPPERLSISS